jgi:CubicO group peptidase (beta-lactamase class C family)
MTNPISQFLQERIDASDFPSAVYLVAEKGEIAFHEALGYAVVEPERIKATTETIYDLASLTKPLVTGLLTAIAIEEGELQLETRIGKFFAEFRDSPISDLTVRELATHTSGMPAWVPLYLFAKSRVSVGKVLADQKSLAKAGTKVEYSDLNFIALAFVLEEPRIDLEFRDEVADPLRLTRTVFNPLTGPGKGSFDRSEIAASEKGNEFEKNTCIDLGFLKTDELRTANSMFRDYQIWGEVHDGNAWFMGGVAGHAGLFSTAEEVFMIAQQFLPDYTTLLKPETTRLFRTNFTQGLNEARSVAFQLAETPESTAGSKMSPQSFGHLGFTGTSLWIDPATERIFILLTNRTHAHPLPFVNINSVRRRFHDLANDLLDKKL